MAEEALLSFCRENKEGVTEEQLSSQLGLSAEELVEALNSLLQKGRLSIFKSGSNLLYKHVDAESAAKLHGLGADELLVYQHIKQSGNMGIWIRDLKHGTNMQQTAISKTLKTLEQRKLIKVVKSIQAKNKKVYMLYELEPSREVTGGAWYSEQEFDQQFISVLSENCLTYIQKKKAPTLQDIANAMRSSGFVKVELREEDIEMIVQTLIYDGKVESFPDPRGIYDAKGPVLCFRISRWSTSLNQLTTMPCGVCPVFRECSEDGIISPQTCVYYSQWLDF
eukprot:GILK01002632.1.p1 GENE.GILK01002632.1~~GILK01002632.1.p1  ORF type:complete len:289 (-),score=49.54 GILK01002632.1:117-956(-)